jgi:hypothetical protein
MFHLNIFIATIFFLDMMYKNTRRAQRLYLISYVRCLKLYNIIYMGNILLKRDN